MKQMKRLSIVWGLLLVAIVALLTTFGILFTKKNKIYTDMEDQLVKGTKKYVERSFDYPKDNKELRIEYKVLKEAGLVSKLSVDKVECDGYSIVKKNGLVYEYKGYVKCPDYTTKNYKK